MVRLCALIVVLAASAFVASCEKNSTSVGNQLEVAGPQAFVYNPVLKGLNGTQVMLARKQI